MDLLIKDFGWNINGLLERTIINVKSQGSI